MDRLSTIEQLEYQLEFNESFMLDPNIFRKVSKELELEIQRLNQETDWIELAGSYDSFLNDITKLENDFSHIDGFQKKEVLNIALKQLDNLALR